MAFKQGLLRLYLQSDPATVDYIHGTVVLTSALLEHPKFRFSMAKEIKEGILSAFLFLKEKKVI